MADSTNRALTVAMTPERWLRLRELFHGAFECTPAERAGYLEAACATDPSLRTEVERLIACYERADGLLEPTPPLPVESPSVLKPGQFVGHYRIIDAIGQGGMGIVYKAEDSKLRRLVALKFLPSAVTDDPQALERFNREAQAASALNHPNVCTIYAIEEHEGRPFIVMELLKGQTLADSIAGRPLAPARLFELSVQIADALQAAHEQGITHRDIKPGNIFVTDRGQAKILDFGLARFMARPESMGDSHGSATSTAADANSLSLTKTGRILGTVPYISPEQLRGEQPDQRSDLFSFGTVLYEMATGVPAFSGSPETTVDAILNRETPSILRSNPTLPTQLDRVVARALAKTRELRYQSAAEVKADLLRIGKGGAEIDGQAAISDGKSYQARRWAGAVAMAIVIAATAVGVLGKMGKSTDGAPAEAPPPVRSIAVLPLENLSQNPEQEYLAAGLTDELITSLSKLRSLRVMARTSAMKYKSRPRSIQDIAKELKVDAILEGTVLPSGNRVRITTQLTDVSSEKSLWAESYEGDLGDVGNLQNRIAQAVIAGIKVKLTPREEQRFASVQTVKSEAYLAYLRGIFDWEKGIEKDDTEAAIAMFERATALDPKFAAAYARLASAYAFTHIRRAPTQEIADKALGAAKESLALDPNLAEAYLAQGIVALWMLHFPAETSVQNFQRALALSPNLCEAHFQMGSAYLHMGLLDEALMELNAALALDPHRFLIRFYVARAHLYQQRYDEALQVYERSPDLPPAQLWEQVLTLFHRGERTAAHELVRQLQQKLPNNEDIASTYAVLLAAEGEKEKAEEQIRLAIRTGEGRRHFHHAEYNIASAYALMGNRRSALQWLRKTAEDGLACYPLFQRDPKLDNLRNDPEFANFLAEMKSLLERRRANL